MAFFDVGFFDVVFFAAALMTLTVSHASRTAAAPGSYTGPQWLRETRGPIGPAKLSRYAQDDELALKLWELSELRTGVELAL